MCFVDEYKPALFLARLFGLAPYKISEKHLELSPIGILYSLIVNFLYVLKIYERITEQNPAEWSQKLTTLLRVRFALVGSALSLVFISSFLRHRKFCAFINALNKFDEMANLKQITNKYRVILWANVLVPIILLVLTHTYFCYSVKDWHFGSLIHYSALSVSVCQYSIIVSCVLRRFRHLQSFVVAGQTIPLGVEKFNRRNSKLHDVWILFADLMDAAEELNAMYSWRSLIWIATLSFGIITRFFSLWNDEIAANVSVAVIDGLWTLVIALLLTNLLAICHFAATEANNVGPTVFCSRSNIFQTYHAWNKEDTFSIGQYFVLRRFHFTAAGGLLRIDLPLLQTIAGVITTYLVILKTPNER